MTEIDLEQMERMQEELEAWQLVCERLRTAGAVTIEDLASPSGINETAGQRAMNAIRAWGEKLVYMRKKGQS